MPVNQPVLCALVRGGCRAVAWHVPAPRREQCAASALGRVGQACRSAFGAWGGGEDWG